MPNSVAHASKQLLGVVTRQVPLIFTRRRSPQRHGILSPHPPPYTRNTHIHAHMDTHLSFAKGIARGLKLLSSSHGKPGMVVSENGGGRGEPFRIFLSWSLEQYNKRLPAKTSR